MPKDYRPPHDPGLTSLPGWLERRVSDYTAGRIAPELAARLEAIPGFTWGQQDAIFAAILDRLAAHAAEHGTAIPAAGQASGEARALRRHVTYLRRKHREGRLPQARVRALERLPGWTWDPDRPPRPGSPSQLFDSGARAVAGYAAEHGTCVIPPGTRAPDGRDLSAWVRRQRTAHRHGRLAKDQVAALESVPGWFWDHWEHQWQQGLDQLLAYVAGHGTAAVPRTHVTSDGFKLGSWAAERRHEMKQGKLTAARAAILQRLPGWRW